jgi:hypothetical protein
VARKKTVSNADPLDPNGLATNGPADDEPAFVTKQDFDLMMSNAPPDPPPPPPPPPPVDSGLEERMRKLEESISKLAQMQREPAAAPTGQSVMGAAQVLVQAGRHLLPPVPLSSSGPPPGQAGRLWFFTDLLAEMQAVYFMYVDPRYRLSWVGRIVPPVLLVLFLLSEWWVKYAFCGVGALPFVNKPIELMLCYLMYKVVTMEARYYRQTAPDLPPSLRL